LTRPSFTRKAQTLAVTAALTLGAVSCPLAPQAQAHAAQPPVASVSQQSFDLMANSVIFFGGIGYEYGSTLMDQVLGGAYAGDEYNKYYVNNEDLYPNTGDDASIDKGVASGLEFIEALRASDPGGSIIIVGASKGSIVGSEINDYLIANNISTDDISMILLVNPSIGNGGLKARLPHNMVVPFTGILGGEPTQAGGAKIHSIQLQYDLISDAPAYVFGPFTGLAWTNAVMGFFFIHPNVYDIDLNDPRNITVTSPDGTLTSTLVYSAQLPLTMPLRAIIPGPIVDAIDRVLRPLIETAYTRPNPSDPSNPANDPSNAIPLALAPSPDKMLGQVYDGLVGAVQGLLSSTPSTSSTNNSSTQSDDTDKAIRSMAKTPDTPSVEPRSSNPPASQEPEVVSKESAPQANASEETPQQQEEENEDVASKSERSSMKDGNKVSPPKRSGASWKPGDLLRKVFTPSVKKSGKSDPAPQESPATEPEQGSAPSTDNTPNDSSNNESGGETDS